jgi:hypothetical protein
VVVEGPAKTKQGSKPPPPLLLLLRVLYRTPLPSLTLSATMGLPPHVNAMVFLNVTASPAPILRSSFWNTYTYKQTYMHTYIHTFIISIYMIQIYIYIYYRNTLSSISSATTVSAPAHSTLVPGAALPGLRRPCVRAARRRRRRRSGGGGINFFS